jgi:hypothetical protein
MACSPPTFTKCSGIFVMGLLSLACVPPVDDDPSSQGGSSGGSGASGGSSGGTRASGAGGSGSGGSGPPASGSGGSSVTSGGTGGPTAGSGGGGGRGGSGGAAGSTGGAGGPSSGDARPVDTAGSDSPGTMPSAPKLSTDVVAITKMRCAVAGCHDPMKKEHGMDLSTAATVFAAWVNKATADHCLNNMAVTRVVPGKPENSFVVTLIQAPPGRCAEVRRMPPPPVAQLPPAEVKVIRDWVAAGALND